MQQGKDMSTGQSQNTAAPHARGASMLLNKPLYIPKYSDKCAKEDALTLNQVIIIPIYWNKRAEGRAAVLAAAERAAGVLRCD